MSIEWKAIYDDGTELPQYNEDGTSNNYKDINRIKISQFILLSNKEPKIIIHLDKNKRLIYRRRVALLLKKGVRKEEIVHLAGWQETRNNANVQMICFLFENGHIEIVDKFKEKHPWFYSIIFMKEEK